jgi:hypothetical protein
VLLETVQHAFSVQLSAKNDAEFLRKHLVRRALRAPCQILRTSKLALCDGMKMLPTKNINLKFGTKLILASNAVSTLHYLDFAYSSSANHDSHVSASQPNQLGTPTVDLTN